MPVHPRVARFSIVVEKACSILCARVHRHVCISVVLECIRGGCAETVTPCVVLFWGREAALSLVRACSLGMHCVYVLLEGVGLQHAEDLGFVLLFDVWRGRSVLYTRRLSENVYATDGTHKKRRLCYVISHTA
jgi:hypothetical protein